MKKPSIVMQSDFGIDSALVSCMHGVVKKVDSDLEIYDISHIITPFCITQASDCLSLALPCWPDGTVFVSVVDPGVGTKRKGSVALTESGSYIVTPDNGTLTKVAMLYGIKAIREIDMLFNRYPDSEDVDVFHGRDVFSYTAARLASGIISFEEVGPEYSTDEIVKYDIPPYTIEDGFVQGYATGSKDNDFGILTTNIPNKEFSKAGFELYSMLDTTLEDDEGNVVFSAPVKFCRTYGDVGYGEPLLYREVALFLGLALNMTNFARTYSIQQGKLYKLTIRRK